MNNRVYFIFFLAWIGCFLFHPGGQHGVEAQEETYYIAHEEVFGKLQRPPVTLPHNLHMESLEQDGDGCGACHHLYDADRGALVPADGEETGCTECHGRTKEGNIVGLENAYHGSCNRCHRTRIKQKNASGPTTCGGCHKKQ
jgi:hypothetical protein